MTQPIGGSTESPLRRYGNTEKLPNGLDLESLFTVNMMWHLGLSGRIQQVGCGVT